MSLSARVLLSDNHYGWISTQMLQIGLTPPSGEFFGTPLSKPSIIIIPLCIFVIAMVNFFVTSGVNSDLNKLISGNKILRSQFDEQTLLISDILAKAQEDPLEFLQTIFFEALRTATPLAFMPIGVAFYFSFQEVAKFYTNIIITLQVISHFDQNNTLARRASFIQNSVKYASILGVCYLCYGTYTQSMITSLAAPLPQTTAVNASIVTSTPENVIITPTYTPKDGEVTTKSLRVRENPNANGRILTGLSKGQKIQIIGISSDNKWLFVEYQENKFGWVAHDFVSVADESSLPQFDEQAASNYTNNIQNTPVIQPSPTTKTDQDILHVYPNMLANIRSIAARQSSFLALTKDGKVISWGKNSCGDATIPVLSNIVAISTGSTFCMALQQDDLLVVWGASSSPARAVPQTTGITKISAGYNHALALNKEGKVLAWGDNSYNQCNVPTFPTTVVDVRAGNDSSAALLSNKDAVIWGNSMAAGTYHDVVDVALADNHALILHSDGSANIAGEIMGDFEIPNTNDYIAIAADQQAHLLLRADHTLIGLGSYYGMKTYVPQNLIKVSAIATGQQQSIALLDDGSVTQFGETQLRP